MYRSDAPTAIVTGSARRVGRAVAAALVEQGWQVLIHSRDERRASEACAALGAAGSVAADLMSAEAADTIAQAARDVFGIGGGLDLLVNSASTFERVDAWETAGVGGWQRAMAVNARAPYLLTCALLPMLRRARGLVVNVSDHSATQHWVQFPIHAASKTALESLTISGAAALAPDHVRMVAIAPGTIMAPESWPAQRVRAEQDAGGLGTPDELVDCILALTEDPGRSGEVIRI